MAEHCWYALPNRPISSFLYWIDSPFTNYDTFSIIFEREIHLMGTSTSTFILLKVVQNRSGHK